MNTDRNPSRSAASLVEKERLVAPASPSAEFRRTERFYPEKVAVMDAMQPFVEEQIDKLLLETGEKAWQPQDFLPDLTQDSWVQDVQEFRKQSQVLTDDLLVVLVGDMVTEEALPTYQTLLNRFEGVDDPTGIDPSPWARWTRGWTSEENRHGDLLNKYLYLTGRVDMRAVEVTIQHLINSGFDTKAGKDPYKGFVYTSFQERATKISHMNVAKLANAQGDKNLALICSKIAGDEARHEKAYQSFFAKVLEVDPNGGLLSFSQMMKEKITMPACFMTDGYEANLFDKFSITAQKTGVYTGIDYAEIMQFLIDVWGIEKMTGLSAEGAAAQEFLCNLPKRYMLLAERSNDRVMKLPKSPFSWIHGREA